MVRRSIRLLVMGNLTFRRPQERKCEMSPNQPNLNHSHSQSQSQTQPQTQCRSVSRSVFSAVAVDVLMAYFDVFVAGAPVVFYCIRLHNRFQEKIAELDEELAAIVARKEEVKERCDAALVSTSSVS